MSLLLLFNQQTSAPTVFGYWGVSMNLDEINNKFQFTSPISPNYKIYSKFESISYTSEINPSYM